MNHEAHGECYGGSAAENYQKYFVPAIGLVVEVRMTTVVAKP